MIKLRQNQTQRFEIEYIHPVTVKRVRRKITAQDYAEAEYTRSCLQPLCLNSDLWFKDKIPYILDNWDKTACDLFFREFEAPLSQPELPPLEFCIDNVYYRATFEKVAKVEDPYKFNLDAATFGRVLQDILRLLGRGRGIF